MTMEPPASLHCENNYAFLNGQKNRNANPHNTIFKLRRKVQIFNVAAETHMKEVKDDVFLHSKKCDTK